MAQNGLKKGLPQAGKEIERKFLVKNNSWRSLATGKRYRQGYLSCAKERVVRVRTVDKKGFLTVKGMTKGASRIEYEYEIPFIEAESMLETLCEKPLIEKKRYEIECHRLVWEVDEFFGENQGLVIAEVELATEDQHYEKPWWVDEEVTGDPRYFNSNLVKRPYSKDSG